MRSKIQVLAQFSPAKTEEFLEELANLPDNESARKYFASRFSHFLPTEELRRPLKLALGQIARAQGVNVSEGELARQVDLREHLRGLQRRVRAIWTAEDDWERLWQVFRLYQDVMQGGNAMLLLTNDPPELIPFMQALLYLLRQTNRVRRCANPDCQAPYFFAKRRGQKYCSTECARPAQQAGKREWWRKHGKQWRASRNKSQDQKPRKRR